MPARFSAAGDKPRIVLPGATNFIGLGEKSLVPPDYLERPHYAHSGLFTHVKVTEDEMRLITARLVESLNTMAGRVQVIVPMGGFSHQDRPGGAIEDASLRAVFLDEARRGLSADIPVTPIDAHIGDEQTTNAILAAYATLHDNKKVPSHL